MKTSLAMLFCISLLFAPINAMAAERTANDLLREVGLNCKLQQGKLICERTKSKKSKKDDNCTILEPGSGGGCKNGKWECTNLKSGKQKCCCLPDAEAKPANMPPAQQPATQNFCCVGTYAAGFKHTTCGGSEANARGNAEATKFDGEGPTTIACAPE